MAPFLVQKWSKIGKILDPLFDFVLGSSGLRFGPQNGLRKSKKRDRKMEQVFERSGRLLELSWKPSWPSWASLGKPDVPEYLQKTYQNTPFRTRFFSL